MDIGFIKFCAKMYAKRIYDGSEEWGMGCFHFSRQAGIGLCTAENLIDVELNALDMDIFIDKIPGVEVDYVL